MVTSDAFRKAVLDAALKGKDLSPDQIMSSMYGRMGGIFGKINGSIGASISEIRPPTLGDMPKPVVQGIDLLKYL